MVQLKKFFIGMGIGFGVALVTAVVFGAVLNSILATVLQFSVINNNFVGMIALFIPLILLVTLMCIMQFKFHNKLMTGGILVGWFSLSLLQGIAMTIFTSAISQ